VKFVEHRIGDRRIVRLIQKWLSAGVMEQGRWSVVDVGSPQGATVLSPLLANIYLHYVYDLWAHQWRKRYARGDMIIVRYADDTVVGFEHEEDGRQFLDDLRRRLVCAARTPFWRDAPGAGTLGEWRNPVLITGAPASPSGARAA
jgi:retron-type reverse transcriptase